MIFLVGLLGYERNMMMTIMATNSNRNDFVNYDFIIIILNICDIKVYRFDFERFDISSLAPMISEFEGLYSLQ